MKLENDPFTSIKLSTRQLTFESHAGIFSDGQDKSHFQTIAKGLGSVLNSFKTAVGAYLPSGDFGSEERAFIKAIQLVPYTTWKEYQATVPAGFVGKYLEYTETLQQEAIALSKLDVELLEPFNHLLATLLSDKDAAKNTSGLDVMKLAIREKRRDNTNAVFGKMFNSGHETTTKAGNVVDRTADWQLVFKFLKTTNENITTKYQASLVAKLAQVEDYLELLLDQHDKGSVVLPKQIIANLGEYAYQIARETEQLSQVSYRANVLGVSIKTTMARFITILG